MAPQSLASFVGMMSWRQRIGWLENPLKKSYYEFPGAEVRTRTGSPDYCKSFQHFHDAHTMCLIMLLVLKLLASSFILLLNYAKKFFYHLFKFLLKYIK